MAKWADYLISAVHYEETDTSRYISRLKVHEDKGGESFDAAGEMTRQRVISKIDAGKTFVTIHKGKESNKWKRGEDIHKVEVDGTAYIRTDRNREESDNLGELPEF